MTRDECVNLLAVIASVDNRTNGESNVSAWHGTVGDLRFGECRDAVVAHFQSSTEWLMPVHIRRLVTAARQDTALREQATPGSSTDHVPMPDWFAASVAEHTSRRRALNDQRKSDGLPPTYGDTVVYPADRQGARPW